MCETKTWFTLVSVHFRALFVPPCGSTLEVDGHVPVMPNGAGASDPVVDIDYYCERTNNHYAFNRH